ncbi:MAG: hypothetical protein ABIW76_18035 [Fibrobacteria bacterium]
MSKGELSDIAARLRRHPGPAYRKAYLANLLDSANRFLAAGNERGAEYCRSKVMMALDKAEVAPTDESANAPASVAAYPDDEPGDASAAVQDSADVDEIPDEASIGLKRRKPSGKPKERPLTPTEIFRRNWRLDRIKDAETILNRHGARLSALEFNGYREKLDNLRKAGMSANAESGAKNDRLDTGLQDLRSRLYGRVLKSQRLSLRGRRMPMTLALLARAPADRSTRPSAQTGIPPLRTHVATATAPGTTVRVDPAWQPVIGPYNDRYNMEDLLSLIADADPAWVEEFLDLYRGLSGMQTLVHSIAALKKT